MKLNKLIIEKNKQIKFDEKNHKYFIDVQELTSVSKTIHQFFPPFMANEIAEKKSEGCPLKKEALLLDWKIRNLSGTAVHNFLEDYVKTGIEPTTSDFENKAKEIGTDMNNLKMRFLGGKQFIKEMAKDGWTPFIPEWIVWSEELGIAGTIDLPLINKEGEIIIADYKCTKGIYKQAWGKREIVSFDDYGIPKFKYTQESAFKPIDHLENCNYIIYSLQLSAYRYLIEKEYGLKVKGCCLVHLPGGSSKYNFHEILDLRDEFKRILEVKT